MSDDTNDEKTQESSSTLEEFREAVKVVRELIYSRDITVRIPSSLRISMTVDESVLDSELEQTSISPEDFKKILRSEIAVMVSVCLIETHAGYEDVQSSYMDTVLDDIADEKKEEVGSLTRQKFELLDDIITKGPLAERYLVKVTSKVNTFDDISWEINEKHYADGREIAPIRYATIKLEFGKESTFLGPFGMLRMLSGGGSSSTVVFDCDLDLLDDLMDELKEIRAKLQGQEGKDK